MWVRDVCARCPRTQPEDRAGRMEDVLDELLQHREPRALRQCLRKVRALGQGGLWGGGLLTAPGAGLRGQPGTLSAQRASVFSSVKREQSWESCRGSSPWPRSPLCCLCTCQALSNSLHPLGKLLRTLMLTFQATYAGIGANKHLQALAQEEVKQHARELWAAYR